MILVHSISKMRHYIVNLFIVYSTLSCFSPIQWNLSNRTLSKIDFLSNSGRISKSQNFAIILSVINYFINWMLSIPNSSLHLRPQYTNFIYNYPVQTHYVTDILNSYSSLCAHITDLNTSIMMMTMIPIMKVKLTKSTLHMTYETMLQKMINFSMVKDDHCTSYKSWRRTQLFKKINWWNKTRNSRWFFFNRQLRQ